MYNNICVDSIQNRQKLKTQLSIKPKWIKCGIFILCSYCTIKVHLYEVQEVVKLINKIRSQHRDYLSEWQQWEDSS